MVNIKLLELALEMSKKDDILHYLSLPEIFATMGETVLNAHQEGDKIVVLTLSEKLYTLTFSPAKVTVENAFPTVSKKSSYNEDFFGRFERGLLFRISFTNKSWGEYEIWADGNLDLIEKIHLHLQDVLEQNIPLQDVMSYIESIKVAENGEWTAYELKTL